MVLIGQSSIQTTWQFRPDALTPKYAGVRGASSFLLRGQRGNDPARQYHRHVELHAGSCPDLKLEGLSQQYRLRLRAIVSFAVDPGKMHTQAPLILLTQKHVLSATLHNASAPGCHGASRGVGQWGPGEIANITGVVEGFRTQSRGSAWVCNHLVRNMRIRPTQGLDCVQDAVCMSRQAPPLPANVASGMNLPQAVCQVRGCLAQHRITILGGSWYLLTN